MGRQQSLGPGLTQVSFIDSGCREIFSLARQDPRTIAERVPFDSTSSPFVGVETLTTINQTHAHKPLTTRSDLWPFLLYVAHGGGPDSLVGIL